MKELTLPATLENIPAAVAFVEQALEEMDCPMKAQMQLCVAADEVFANIASYAYAPAAGEATVRICKQESPSAAVITFLDRGVAYDPLAKADPNITLSAEEREIGGLGVFIVKKSVDEMTYAYEDGQNILTIKKYF